MSGDGQSRLKNCPGLTASALGEASTIMCLYSEFTQSCARIGASASSAGMCVSSGGGELVPTTKGAEANGWCIRDPFSHDPAGMDDPFRSLLYQNQENYQIVNNSPGPPWVYSFYVGMDR